MDLDASGFEDVQAMLRKLADGGVRASKAGMRAAVKLRKDAVVAAAPERPALPKSTTALEPGAFKRDIRASVKQISGTDEVAGTVFPGSATAHAQGWVEFGHRLVKGGYSNVNPDGKSRGPGQEIGDVPSHPFWRPIEETTEQAALDAYVEGASAEVEVMLKEGV